MYNDYPQQKVFCLMELLVLKVLIAKSWLVLNRANINSARAWHAQ